jgi:hypothetical protein
VSVVVDVEADADADVKRGDVDGYVHSFHVSDSVSDHDDGHAYVESD